MCSSKCKPSTEFQMKHAVPYKFVSVNQAAVSAAPV